MESLINYQFQLFSRMAKAKSNFKKSPIERINKDYIEGRLELLEQIWFEFSAGHKELMRSELYSSELADTEYIQKEIYDQCEEIYFDYKLELKAKLSQFQKMYSNKSEVTCSSVSSNVKLPKVNIPKFSGKYSEWNTFRDLFHSLININKDLGNVQKLLYLKGYLEGEAEQLICNIPITDCNYERCWKLLEERYSNKKYICRHILKRLFSQKNIVNESASGLKELMDTTNDCLSALSNIGIQTDSWDVLVIHILTLKLDPESKRQWEFSAIDNSSDELPTYKQFENFMNNRYRALEFLESGLKPVYKNNFNNKYNVNKFSSMHVTSAITCIFCSESHKLNNCKGFQNESIDSRRNFVLNNNVCFCCLGSNHSAKYCRSNIKCRICNKKHHALLHPMGKVNEGQVSQRGRITNDVIRSNDASLSKNVQPSTSTASMLNVKNVYNESDPIVSCISTRKQYNQVLLATALVNAMSKSGRLFTIRALLDQGSQSSFVTESMVQMLGLKKIPVQSHISGVGGENGLISKAMVNFNILSRIDQSVVINVKAYVLKSITTLLPSKEIQAVEWKELAEIVLADPGYYTSNRIDMLLGSEVYSKIIQDGIKRGPNGSPLAQCTSLGWILSGVVDSTTQTSERINVMHCQVEENELLKKFWELEDDVPMLKEKLYTNEEKRCEEIFSETTRRDESGRYIVQLPFKSENPEVSCSLQIAEKRLYSLERRLTRLNLKEKYKEVINEYIAMNHMELIPENEIKNKKAIYLPHHFVLRDDKDTTKIRVVYDASCKGNNNKSLNDNLLVGPTIQSDLRHIVMRWRMKYVCLSADIVQMYRQVKVDRTDIDFQRILWRDNEHEKLKHYRLTRVTFGVASAPYLAIKSLQQVAIDEGHNYPLAAEKVLTDFYVDDLMTNCETAEEGLKLYKEMNALVEKGGFCLQKWTTNNDVLLRAMKEDEKNCNKNFVQKEENVERIKIKTDEIIKIVGLTWNRSDDTFRYKVDVPAFDEPVTKRKIISDISRFYDPLGWAGPSIIIAKIIIQKLWLAGISWDEAVPNELIKEWITYRQELIHLTNITIPRWTGVAAGNFVELHGFCDASKDAYAAVVYTRVIDTNGKIRVALISAKTKVAPIKQVSIPRLELCGAVLLTRLLIEIASVLKIDKTNLHAWTDSTVVLAWLNSTPNRWKVFVANRVSEIITSLNSHHWSHITSKCNPADAASRGLYPSDFVKDNMWFQGPEFLYKEKIYYVKPKNNKTDLEIVKVKSHCINTEIFNWERFSSLTRLIRVIAYCKRFINNVSINKLNKLNGFLTSKELKEAMNFCIKQCQYNSFEKEIEILKKGQYLPKRNSLHFLNLFVDDDNILRVGGRLVNTQFDERRKHPILLPKGSFLTNLIILDAHKQTLHGGPQLMMCYLQSRYWILGVKQLTKSVFRKCVTCVKNNANIHTQLMGQLPSARVTPTRAFKCSGVDYAGPIQLRTSKGRGHKSYKGYICLFVCMVTRAIHLEVVSDLTSEGFLQAFKRFVARRGYCSDIWSDNATNFTGASAELRHLFNDERNSMRQEIAEQLATNGCTWHFIPSHSPNFGGLWEAGIKSVKYHLKRVIGQSTLTFEEMTTVLAQIEACLNSRPLSTLTCNESDDVSLLTPGHFLVGEALVTPPDRNFESSNISSLRRWQYTQRMLQDFWRQWSHQYLTKFYKRYRWSSVNPQPKVGDVVVVKEDNLPPGRWLYGRVVTTHPGHDNIVRVVSVKVKNGILKRPISKIFVLPVTE